MTDDEANPQTPVPANRQAVAAQDRSPPGKIGRRLRAALDGMVWGALKREDAAIAAGLKPHSLYVALRRPHVASEYLRLCEVLRTSGKAKRIHRLEELSEQDVNRNAAVAAIKTLEGIADDEVRRPGMATAPGVIIVIDRTAQAPAAVPDRVIDLSEPATPALPAFPSYDSTDDDGQ